MYVRWAKGWSRLGAALAKIGTHKMAEAVSAYERSLHLQVWTDDWWCIDAVFIFDRWIFVGDNNVFLACKCTTLMPVGSGKLEVVVKCVCVPTLHMIASHTHEIMSSNALNRMHNIAARSSWNRENSRSMSKAITLKCAYLPHRYLWHITCHFIPTCHLIQRITRSISSRRPTSTPVHT